MPLYSVDSETRNMITYAVSVYKFRNHLSGFGDLSAYLTALSFEKIIRQTGRKLNLESELKFWEEITSKKVMEFLRNGDLVSEREYEDLKKCRDFRNKIMHEGLHCVTIEETKEALQKVCEMAEISFEKQLERREFEDILSFGERKIKPKSYKKIRESDFDEFISLYDKCVSLQQELEKNLGSLSLVAEEISEFVPTSGGIWLPWVLEHAGSRSHMKRITLGITFTPSSIRIGLDFGSKAYDPKKQYYKLLMEGKFDPLLSRLPQGYSLYETYWYYHVRGVTNLRQYVQPADSPLFRHQIKEAYKEIGDKILRREKMTGHKFLIGKIINRTGTEFEEVLLNLEDIVCKTFEHLVPILKMVE